MNDNDQINLVPLSVGIIFSIAALFAWVPLYGNSYLSNGFIGTIIVGLVIGLGYCSYHTITIIKDMKNHAS